MKRDKFWAQYGLKPGPRHTQLNRETRRIKHNMAKTFKKAFAEDILKVLAWGDDPYPYLLPDKMVFHIMRGMNPNFQRRNQNEQSE